MLSPLKKKSEKAPQSMMPRWHPDFRRVEQLPDVKVVRTAFFINVATVFVAAVMIVWFAVHEYHSQVISSQLRDLNARIAANKLASDKAIALNGKFQEEAKKAVEIGAFTHARFRASELIINLSQATPNDIALSAIDIQENGVVIRGGIAGSADQASGHASDYLELLHKDAWFGGHFESFALDFLTREAGNNRLLFQFSLKYKGQAASSKP